MSAAFAGLTYAAAATEPAKTPSAARRVIFELIALLLADEFSRDGEEVLLKGTQPAGESGNAARSSGVGIVWRCSRYFGAAAVAAPEKLRIGTPEAVGFNFYMLDAGIDLGIFRKYDLDIERIDLEGGAKLHQAMAAGAIDIALGGGTDLLFVAKGSPEKAVAVLGTSPANLSILVLGDSPIKTIADLKGKKIAATTVGSLTSWFAQEIARHEGWGVDGVTLVYLGGTESMMAGLTTKTVDAASASLEVGHIRGDRGRQIPHDRQRRRVRARFHRLGDLCQQRDARRAARCVASLPQGLVRDGCLSTQP